MQRIHMDHRFAAYIAFALIAATFAALIPLRRAYRDVVRAAGIALALAGLQIALGIGAVLSGLQPVLRSIHQANGALLAASLTALTYLAFVQRQADAMTPLAQARPLQTPLAQAKRYLTLTKPKVVSLLLFTTLTSMMIAKAGFPSVQLVIATLLGGALAAGAAGAINMVLDRDIDARMARTAKRPIPTGQIPAAHALAFGVVLGVLSFAVLATFVNLLSAVLAFLGIVYYVFVYTVWLKRWTPQNIVIGGAAGAIPPLVGWAAVTDHVGLTAALLFLIVFVWTPPHFWALSLIAKEQYAKAGVPMLPVVRGDAETKRQILWYTIVLIGLTLAAVPLRMMGTLYLACALALDAAFLYYSVRVVSIGSIASERTLYKFSMLYLALLFAAMVVDRIARGTGV
jgi:protoheme IX farnesyltransferase